MRIDIIFYTIGIICFILTAYIPTSYRIDLIIAAFMVVLILFGLFFMATGYSTRPKKYKIIPPPKPIQKITEEEKPPQLPPPPTPKEPEEISKPTTELTKIKGIGPKRIDQLKTLQITSVEELAQLSAEELATKLKISSKITAKWIEQAQKLLKETETS